VVQVILANRAAVGVVEHDLPGRIPRGHCRLWRSETFVEDCRRSCALVGDDGKFLD
jgi:hypothetical protein